MTLKREAVNPEGGTACFLCISGAALRQLEAGEAHQFDMLSHRFLVPSCGVAQQAERNVLAHGEPGEEPVFLEHGAALQSWAGNPCPLSNEDGLRWIFRMVSGKNMQLFNSFTCEIYVYVSRVRNQRAEKIHL